jgi:ribosomal protein S25
MGELDGLTAGQMREAAEVLRAWVAERQHDAQVAAEVLDQATLDEAAAEVDRVEAVRAALLAAVARREREGQP